MDNVTLSQFVWKNNYSLKCIQLLTYIPHAKLSSILVYLIYQGRSVDENKLDKDQK